MRNEPRSTQVTVSLPSGLIGRRKPERWLEVLLINFPPRLRHPFFWHHSPDLGLSAVNRVRHATRCLATERQHARTPQGALVVCRLNSSDCESVIRQFFGLRANYRCSATYNLSPRQFFLLFCIRLHLASSFWLILSNWFRQSLTNFAFTNSLLSCRIMEGQRGVSNCRQQLC